jgi:hypothetical protein
MRPNAHTRTMGRGGGGVGCNCDEFGAERKNRQGRGPRRLASRTEKRKMGMKGGGGGPARVRLGGGGVGESQGMSGEEWGGGVERWRRVGVSESRRAHAQGSYRGRQRWHVGHKPAGLGWPNMNSVAFYLFKELF